MLPLLCSGLLFVTLLGLPAGTDAGTGRQCYNCLYDSAVSQNDDCKVASPDMSMTMCDGVCVVDRVDSTEQGREFVIRRCSASSKCYTLQEMNFVSYGWGTRHCCDVDFCNTSGHLRASSAILVFTTILSALSLYYHV